MSDSITHGITVAVVATMVKSTLEYSFAAIMGKKINNSCIGKAVDLVIFGSFGVLIDIDHIPYYFGYKLGWFEDFILSLGPFQGRLLHPVYPVLFLLISCILYSGMLIALIELRSVPKYHRSKILSDLNYISGLISYVPALFFGSLTHLFFDYGIACVIWELSCRVMYLPNLSRILFP